ncbi:hypothetical protein FS837_011549, partial [Tulasnella sp. UAMH 9824]
MASCVTTPRQTVYSTPVNVQTITNTITRTSTIPGAEVTQTFYYTQCIDEPVIGRFRRLKRQVECPNGTTVSTSYSVSTSDPQYGVTVEINYDYVTNRGDPRHSDHPESLSTDNYHHPPANKFHLFLYFRSIPNSPAVANLQCPTASQDNIVVGHKSTKTAAIAGGVVAGLLFLAAVAGAVYYFKWKAGGAGGAGKGGHHGHHGGEKEDLDGAEGGGGGGASGAQHAPGHGHVAHNVPPPHLPGTGIETSAVGGGGGAGGPAGTAPGGGGAGMDTSAVAGGGYGGTAPPSTGFEGQFS